MGYRVVVAADSAGYSYKELIRQDLESDRRVDEVIDAGLSEVEEIDYPHIAVKAQTSSGRPLRVVETYAAVSW